MNQKKRTILYLLLGLYGLFLIWVILLKAPISPDDIQYISRMRHINLIPFYYDNEVDSHFNEVLMNVLVFIPFGLYLKLLNLDSKKAIGYGLAVSLVLEILQFLFAIGGTDVTDLITNTGGTALGVMLYIALIRVFRKKDTVDRVLMVLASLGTAFIAAMSLLLIIANQ